MALAVIRRHRRGSRRRGGARRDALRQRSAGRGALASSNGSMSAGVPAGEVLLDSVVRSPVDAQQARPSCSPSRYSATPPTKISPWRPTASPVGLTNGGPPPTLMEKTTVRLPVRAHVPAARRSPGPSRHRSARAHDLRPPAGHDRPASGADDRVKPAAQAQLTTARIEAGSTRSAGAATRRQRHIPNARQPCRIIFLTSEPSRH